jgi:hypothetical protein
MAPPGQIAVSLRRAADQLAGAPGESDQHLHDLGIDLLRRPTGISPVADRPAARQTKASARVRVLGRSFRYRHIPDSGGISAASLMTIAQRWHLCRDE